MATTVADIAARAGVTERTFSRHFAHKREVHFGDPEVYSSVFTDAAAAAAAGRRRWRRPAALEAAGGFFVDRHHHAGIRQRIIDAYPALQEREQIKRLHLTEAITEALRARGVTDATARPTAERGTVAFHHAFTRWVTAEQDTDLAEPAVTVLGELRAAAA
ncbi:MAG: helix-turn-helix transcriptional regulator [Acidobacteria bacterium]|nr:helix-turn-helix transcriptional regulator [Acidobacteriota bacterium]